MKEIKTWNWKANNQLNLIFCSPFSSTPVVTPSVGRQGLICDNRMHQGRILKRFNYESFTARVIKRYTETKFIFEDVEKIFIILFIQYVERVRGKEEYTECYSRNGRD
jgi:hypothetical protein